MEESVTSSSSSSVVQAHGHRPVGVAADPDAVHVLAEVQVGVLVAQDRQPDLARLVVAPDELGDLAGLRVLVGQRQQRHVHADHRADRRAPEAGAGHDDVGRDHPVGGAHPGDPAARLLDADDAGASPGRARRAPRRAVPGRRPRAPALARPSVGVCRPPRTRSRSSSGCSRTHSSASTIRPRRPRTSASPAAVQVGEPLRGRGDLQPTDLLEAPRAVEVEAGAACRRCRSRTAVIVFDGLAWNTSPGACEVEPPVSGSGPWSMTVTSVEAARGELVGEVRPDDPGSDDHDAG